MSTFLQRFRRFSTEGFTIVELMVVVSIIVLITTVILFRHEQFNSTTLLRSLAYSVALSVRQAQTYGTSVRGVADSASTLVFAPSYAVYFKAGEGNGEQYFLAADLNGMSGIATDGSEDISPSPYRIRGGFSISNFCAVKQGASECSGNNFITYLAVTFRRPDPDACFATNLFPAACSPGGSPQYQSACIELVSPGGDTRTVRITNTGQISVSAAAAACTS